MTRAELESQFKVQGNRIVSAGKFESENIWAPYFWDVTMDGGARESAVQGGRVVYTVAIEPEDIEQFPELEGFRHIVLYEDDNGFVYCVAQVRP